MAQVFRHLRLRKQPVVVATEPGPLSAAHLTRDPSLPITLRAINALPENVKKRVYRALLPPSLLTRFNIDPLTWKGPDGDQYVLLIAEPETAVVKIAARYSAAAPDTFAYVELADNAFNGIDLNFLLLYDPESPRFRTDYDVNDRSTLFGTVNRNLAEEEQAMQAGLAPAQVSAGLNVSRLVLNHIESFLSALGHRALFLEPLTYVSAWAFERRGFAYVRGHKLMDEIHHAFQPGRRLHQALDGSTPFRQPDQWRTVRGRAWAIHDGILNEIGASWDRLRMVKQVGRHAGVNTFPSAIY